MDLVSSHIVDWLKSYCDSSKLNGFVVGVSGGIDSAVTSILCAQTGKRVVLLNMPIRQHDSEYKLAQLHINRLNALGHNAYLVNVRDNDDNRSMVFMRIGQYTTRMEAKKVAFSLLSLDNTRFEVFRIASSAKN